MIKTRKNVTPGETPVEITVSMIDQDLKNGISKSEMAIKYGIKPWEVDEMFKHPFLKGRRPSRKKALSFTFVDDITDDMLHPEDVETEESMPLDAIKSALPEADEVDPNQITLEDAIDEAIESVEVAKETLNEIVEEIDDIFPTEIIGIPNGNTMSDTDDELEEEELKMNDDTFEL